MSSKEINTSLGVPGEPESRTFSRLYQTLANPINEIAELTSGFNRLTSLSSGYRRIVLRCLCSEEVLSQALQADLPIEAVIPMNLVTDDNSAIVFLGKNYHDSPHQGRNIEELISKRNNHKTPIEKIMAIPEGFKLTNELRETDVEDLFSLWERFGWNREQIINFIQSNQDSLWFSAVRDSRSNRLVAASTAEAMEFAGIKYVETTEYSTLDGYGNLGLCTASVAGLVAQVLNSQQTSLPVITAEFNTSSTSAAIGASAGFVIPKIDRVPQILSYNVAVTDNAPANPIFENESNNRGIPNGFLRNFAVAVLPRSNIVNLYPPEIVEQIIRLYN